MTIVTQDEDIARSAEVLETLRDAIRDLRREVEGLTEKARSDGTMDDKATKQTLSGLRDLILQCTKAENILNDCKSKQTGYSRRAYALDLDRARVEIGCKLDRLRRCGRPRAVPE